MTAVSTFSPDLPLIALCDLEELGKTNTLYAELDRIVKANGGTWCAKAEKICLKTHQRENN